MVVSRTLLLHAASNEANARRHPYDYVSDAQLEYLAVLAAEASRTTETIEFSFDDGHESVSRAVDLIREVSQEISIKVFIPTFIFQQQGKEKLDPIKLRSLSKYKNLTIGSHGHYHRPLTSLIKTELKEELTKSKAILEELLEKEVLSISYPYGEVNSMVREIARAVGFTEGYTSFWGINTLTTDPLSYHRIQILGNDSRNQISKRVKQSFYPRGIAQKIRYFRRLI